jgi:hypothetical protein
VRITIDTERCTDMAGIRNSCVARGVAAASSNAVVYTVPADKVLLLKSFLLRNEGGAAQAVSANLGDPTATTFVAVFSGDIASAATENLQTWVALNAGDQVYIGTTNAAVAYWISGALLPEVI